MNLEPTTYHISQEQLETLVAEVARRTAEALLPNLKDDNDVLTVEQCALLVHVNCIA